MILEKKGMEHTRLENEIQEKLPRGDPVLPSARLWATPATPSQERDHFQVWTLATSV